MLIKSYGYSEDDYIVGNYATGKYFEQRLVCDEDGEYRGEEEESEKCHELLSVLIMEQVLNGNQFVNLDYDVAKKQGKISLVDGCITEMPDFAEIPENCISYEDFMKEVSIGETALSLEKLQQKLKTNNNPKKTEEVLKGYQGQLPAGEIQEVE